MAKLLFRAVKHKCFVDIHKFGNIFSSVKFGVVKLSVICSLNDCSIGETNGS